MRRGGEYFGMEGLDNNDTLGSAYIRPSNIPLAGAGSLTAIAMKNVWWAHILKLDVEYTDKQVCLAH